MDEAPDALTTGFLSSTARTIVVDADREWVLTPSLHGGTTTSTESTLSDPHGVDVDVILVALTVSLVRLRVS